MPATLSNPGTKVLPPASLAHIVLRTNNFDAMRAFYKTFLGATASFENDRMCFLTYDEEHHRIALASLPEIGPKDRKTSGLDHIAFSYASLDDLALAYLQRKENGILPVRPVNHGPTTSLYYLDPDGNTLETQIDNFDTKEEAKDFMHTDDFRVNPFGVDFDAEDLVERLKAGDDHASIKKRPASGPRGLEDVPGVL